MDMNRIHNNNDFDFKLKFSCAYPFWKLYNGNIQFKQWNVKCQIIISTNFQFINCFHCCNEKCQRISLTIDRISVSFTACYGTYFFSIETNFAIHRALTLFVISNSNSFAIFFSHIEITKISDVFVLTCSKALCFIDAGRF